MGHTFPFASNSIMARYGAGLYLKSGYFVQHGFFCIHLDVFPKTLLHENMIYLDD